MGVQILYEGNDTVVEISGLQNSTTKKYITDATVSFVVQKDGVNVSGQVFPTTMTYVDKSRGVYRGLLSAAANISENDLVDVIVSVSGDGLVGEIKSNIKVKRRTGV